MTALPSTRARTGALQAVPRSVGLRLTTEMAALLALAAGAALYLATMAPTVLWGDDAELQRIVFTGEPRVIGQSSGASHLLWLAIARAVARHATWLPLDPAGRATLVTALFGALALAAVSLAAAELGQLALVGLCAAAALALSHTLWLLAVRPDVYTLQTALLAGAVWCVLRWRRAAGRPVLWLLGAGALCLVALTNHVMILASLPGLAWLALCVAAPRRRWMFLAGAVLALLVVIAAAVAGAAGGPLSALVTTLLAFRPAFPGLRDVLPVPIFLAYQFPVAFLLAIPGIAVLWRRDRAVLLGLCLLYAGNAILPLLIRVHDRFQFFLPSYLPIAFLIGVGAGALWDGVSSAGSAVAVGHATVGRDAGRWRGPRIDPLAARWGVVLALGAPLLIYPLAAVAGGAVAARVAPARTLPGRDPIGFYLWPPKTGYTGARTYGEAAFAAVAPRAAIVADWLPYETLRYLQTIEGRRPDVDLQNINAGGGAQLSFLLAQDGQRPLYLADNTPFPYYEMPQIERCFAVQRESVVYRLVRRSGACT